MPPRTDAFPDVEQLLVGWLSGPQSGVDTYAYCTRLPASITQITVRVSRTSGANRSIRVDRPIVDIDVYALSEADGAAAARLVQQAVLSMRGVTTQDGYVQLCTTVIGPRWMPDVNPELFRFGASYEFHTHA
jgi:hypothetical protein